MTAADSGRLSFTELMERYRAGDPSAAEVLLSRYNRVIREAVRRRLPPELRTEYESLDLVQEVWAAFCATKRCEFKSSAELRTFLVDVARNRVVDVYRRRLTQRRNSGRLDHQLEPGLVGSEPTPSQWAMAGERWQGIADALPASHVAIIERLREGFTQQEVAEMSGVSIRTISRIVQRVQRLCIDEGET